MPMPTSPGSPQQHSRVSVKALVTLQKAAHRVANHYAKQRVASRTATSRLEKGATCEAETPTTSTKLISVVGVPWHSSKAVSKGRLLHVSQRSLKSPTPTVSSLAVPTSQLPTAISLADAMPSPAFSGKTKQCWLKPKQSAKTSQTQAYLQPLMPVLFAGARGSVDALLNFRKIIVNALEETSPDLQAADYKPVFHTTAHQEVVKVKLLRPKFLHARLKRRISHFKIL
jgi:hypothetical protein